MFVICLKKSPLSGLEPSVYFIKTLLERGQPIRFKPETHAISINFGSKKTTVLFSFLFVETKDTEQDVLTGVREISNSVSYLE